MASRRRIRVAYQGRKINFSIAPTAKIHDLTSETAATFKISTHGLVLTDSEGCEMRPEDSVDIIVEGELVTARYGSTTLDDDDDDVEMRPISPQKPHPAPQDSSSSSPDPVDRLQIRLVTAEMARRHANATPKETSEPPNSIPAFDGEFINANMSLGDLQVQSCSMLDWNNSPDFVMREDHCNHPDSRSCSCVAAQEIEEFGLATTYHCRRTIDGTNCAEPDCQYSHAKLTVNNSEGPLHCSVCDDALGFPCPTCLKKAADSNLGPDSVVDCPLVQNAGCHHLHHAHCLGARSRGSSARGCPSGCPTAQFPREPVVFGMTQPHLIIVWNGDKISRIPVPKRAFIQGDRQGLTTDKVVSLVEDFLTKQKCAHAGLSLRIHARDPTTETLFFTLSTLVSVCSAVRHTSQSHRRFDLFPTQAPKPITPRHLTKNSFSVDFHTDKGPIMACRCTRLKDLFPSSNGLPIVLYVVRRKNATDDNEADRREIASKETVYALNAAWQPSQEQTSRGMSALLSSLYVLSHSVAVKGVLAEQRVLAMLYMLCRFPPAVRTLAILLMNKVPEPEEKAALSEALFHAVLQYAHAGPAAIAHQPNRVFELIRILLGHLVTAADGIKPSVPGERLVSDISLVCSLSQNRLTDPVMMGSMIVDRSSALVRQPGQELFRPGSLDNSFVELEPDHILRQILAQSPAVTSRSTLALKLAEIIPIPPASCFAVESIARDFVQGIRRTNETDLVTRGPLDLKSANVIPPQVVLDQTGLLAVFTGRGCGSTLDVNFFRPANGGDTAVDVNVVSQALQRVIAVRKMEDTWQVDSFDGVSAITRPPDEAIVLCLDLSQSMNERSGVSSGADDESEPFDYKAEADKIVLKLTENMTRAQILAQAKLYIQDQHNSAQKAWKQYINESLTNRRARSVELVTELEILARREALRLYLEDQEHPGPGAGTQASQIKMACFASAGRHQISPLVDSFMSIVSTESVTHVGTAPFDVPANLLDPKSGNLLQDPVCPSNAPAGDTRTFVSLTSKQWFERQASWPFGCAAPTFRTAAQVESALSEWVSGNDLLPTAGGSSLLSINFVYQGSTVTWDLPSATPTKTLYGLVHRATRACYSTFTLRFCGERTNIPNSPATTIGMLNMPNHGVVELAWMQRHSREPREVRFTHFGTTMIALLPGNAPILTLFSHVHTQGRLRLSKVELWAGLTYRGDGVKTGYPTKSHDQTLNSLPGNMLDLECMSWHWRSNSTKGARDESRYLTRLHLLKELFNVFVNRISSFDTKVSLVLGLVTFSDSAATKQQLTPIFENFRQELDNVSAQGDTAVYDALEKAGDMLVNFRPDMPDLRKRIIIVTDGDDTSSVGDPKDVCKVLVKHNIIVDSVQVGEDHDPTLHAISVVTGGYRFYPETSLGDALSIFDLETMLNSAERPARLPMKGFRSLQPYKNTFHHPIDEITMDIFPKRAEHSKLRQSVKPAAAASAARTFSTDDRLKRIMQEIKAVVADPHPQIDVYVNDEDISFLKLILVAPDDAEDEKCPYKDGCFLLTCDLPEGYPRDPPEIRFVTFILHPNVSKQGKVCIAELGRLWSSDISLKEIFSLIYGLLLEPDLENPLEIQASLKYYDDDGTYALLAAEAVQEHAWKTREAWRTELEDDVMEVDSEDATEA
ncbi:hypothetical protein C8J56DRAFT_1029289 [Mycena floridula]|nr:hypothetical protein C8J56DRAFT_1029289 [Mycena floridula]